MAIVTVKNKYQIVIPQSVREELGIKPGDILEAKVERGKLTYTRKALIDRVPRNRAERDRFFKQFQAEAPDWLKEMWAASKRRGTDKLSMRQIDAIIAEVRAEQTKKKTKHPAP